MTIEELEGYVEELRHKAHDAPRNTIEAPSSAYSRFAREWGVAKAALEQRKADLST